VWKMCGNGEKNPKNRGYRGSDNADKMLQRHSVNGGNAHKCVVAREWQPKSGTANKSRILHIFVAYIHFLYKSECEPVRVAVKTIFLLSMAYISNQSGKIWHSLSFANFPLN